MVLAYGYHWRTATSGEDEDEDEDEDEGAEGNEFIAGTRLVRVRPHGADGIFRAWFSHMNSLATAWRLKPASIAITQMWRFLNIEPAEARAGGFRNRDGRMRYWRETGAFCGGLTGIFGGFVLSYITKLGSIPIGEMLLGWALLCLTGAVVAGCMSSLCVRRSQFKPTAQIPLLSKQVCQAIG